MYYLVSKFPYNSKNITHIHDGINKYIANFVYIKWVLQILAVLDEVSSRIVSLNALKGKSRCDCAKLMKRVLCL